MVFDRRNRRAHSPLLAAEYLLEAHRTRGDAKAVALFDGREMLMLAVSSASRADEVTLRMWVGDVSQGGDGPVRDCYVHRLSLWGRELVVASLDGRLQSVKAIETGLHRILAE